MYINDALVISDNTDHVLGNDMWCYFTLKEESIGPPKIYLGGSLRKFQLDKGVKCWSFSSSQYFQSDLNNVEEFYPSSMM